MEQEAHFDLVEIKGVDMFILDTLDESPTGGREVELGYFLASPMNKPFWRVGPIRNIFHSMADMEFETWDEVRKKLR